VQISLKINALVKPIESILIRHKYCYLNHRNVVTRTSHVLFSSYSR